VVKSPFSYGFVVNHHFTGPGNLVFTKAMAWTISPWQFFQDRLGGL
jgi:hypothetical protein